MTPDFEDLPAHVNDEGARYLIVGAYAVCIYRGRERRKTSLSDRTPPTPKSFGGRSKILRAGCRHTAFRTGRTLYVFTWGNPPFRVDILTRISGVTFEDAWNRRTV